MRCRSWMLAGLGLAAGACAVSACGPSAPSSPPQPPPSGPQPAAVVARIVPQGVTSQLAQSVVKDGAGRRWVLALGSDLALLREPERGRVVLRATAEGNIASAALARDSASLYLLVEDSAWPPPLGEHEHPESSWSVERWSFREGGRVATASLGKLPGIPSKWSGLFPEPTHLTVQHCTGQGMPCVRVRLRSADLSEVDRKEIPFAARREPKGGSPVEPLPAESRDDPLVYKHAGFGPGFPWIQRDNRSHGSFAVEYDGHGAVAWMERVPKQGHEVVLLPGGRPELPAGVGSAASTFGFRRVGEESEIVFAAENPRALERRRVQDRAPLDPLPWNLGNTNRDRSEIQSRTDGADVIVATFRDAGTKELVRYDRVSWSPAPKVGRLPVFIDKNDPTVWEGPAGPQRWGLADVKAGAFIVDLAGRRPAVRIRPQGLMLGAIAGADGSLYTAESAVSKIGEPAKRWLRVYAPNGKRQAEYALPTLATSRSIPMGWSAAGERQLWLAGSDDFHACMTVGPCGILLVTLPEQPSGAPEVEMRVRRIEGEGELYALGAEGLFAVALTGEIGVRFYRGDGSTVLTMGMFEGEPFAYAPDGRWACRGRGCAALACVEGIEPKDAGAPACKGSRVEGFDLLAEARAPAAVPAGTPSPRKP